MKVYRMEMRQMGRFLLETAPIYALMVRALAGWNCALIAHYPACAAQTAQSKEACVA
jgi:hypothetical protein